MLRTGFDSHCICHIEGRSWRDSSGRSSWSSFGLLCSGLNQMLSAETTGKAHHSSNQNCRLTGDFTVQVGWTQRARNCQSRLREWETNSSRFLEGLFCLCFSTGSGQELEELKLCTYCVKSEDILKNSLHPEANTLFSSSLHCWKQNILKLLFCPHSTPGLERIFVSGTLRLTWRVAPWIFHTYQHESSNCWQNQSVI